MVSVPTCVQGSSSSILDLTFVIENLLNTTDSNTEVVNGISDRKLTVLTLNPVTPFRGEVTRVLILERAMTLGSLVI